jgi:hypothetical protein
MTKGVLIAAFDSITSTGEKLHYRRLAKFAAQLAREQLNLPVALITDEPIDGFEETVVVDKPLPSQRIVRVGKVHDSFPWYNNIRIQANKLTPWDQTLMIDADFMISNSQLNTLFDTDIDFALAGSSDVNLIGFGSNDDSKDKNRYQLMPDCTIPQYWATVMYWNHTADEYFEYAKTIAENYVFYAANFNFNPNIFRNDYVFSIVAHMLPTQQLGLKFNYADGDCLINFSDGVLSIDQHVNTTEKFDPKPDWNQIIRLESINLKSHIPKPNWHIINKQLATDYMLQNFERFMHKRD